MLSYYLAQIIILGGGSIIVLFALSRATKES